MREQSTHDRLLGIEVAALQLLHELAKGACHDARPYDVAFYVAAERKVSTLFRDVSRMIAKGE